MTEGDAPDANPRNDSAPNIVARSVQASFDRLCELPAGGAERSAQRRALAELDDNRLRDIGCTRAEVLVAARKPFWRR
jgi:hypothetical protein